MKIKKKIERKKLKSKFELKRIFKVKLYYIIFVFFIFNNSAFAYLDPGSGSLIVQFLVATCATFVIFIKQIITNIKLLYEKYISKNKNKKL